MEGDVIISVGVRDPYVKYVQRLERSLQKYWNGDTMIFAGEYPPGSPSHQQRHYAFKVAAIREALRRGYKRVLYLDSPAVAVDRVEPLFDILGDKGYLLVPECGHFMQEWISDSCLEWLKMKREQVVDKFCVAGGFVGIDFNNSTGKLVWDWWSDGCDRGFSQVLWRHNSIGERARSISQEGIPLSIDPGIKGHLGEEAVLGALAIKFNLYVQQTGDNWQANSPEGCIFHYAGYDGKDLQ